MYNNTNGFDFVGLSFNKRKAIGSLQLNLGNCYNKGSCRICDVESTSLTLIQRRNNIVYPVGIISNRPTRGQFVIPTGLYSDSSIFRQVVIPTGLYSDRSIFRQVVIRTGLYSDRSIFRQVYIPTSRYSDRSLFRQFLDVNCNEN